MSPYLSHHTEDMEKERLSDIEHVFPYINACPDIIPSSLDPFTITTSTGFLPLHTPGVELPAPFKPLTNLLEQMSIVRADGQPGLLAGYKLGPAVDDGGAMPDLSCEVESLVAADGTPDLAAVTAVFRDYAFLASAYLLEPCWERWDKGLDGYGLGRKVLPACIAGPLVKTAKLLDIPPFLSYAAAYSLYNYCLDNPDVGLSDYANLRLVRAFEKGLDPASSEAGFVLTHVDMVKHSSGLIKGAVDVLETVATDASNVALKTPLNLLISTMEVIETSMESMWSHSKPKDYLGYRTFIFGITNQSMFPGGVIYEGINGNKPMSFRGESGANDSMIPLLDALLEIPMPQNPLTDILKDFRSYRPKPHRDFLAYVRTRAADIGVQAYCCRDVATTGLYLRLLDHVRSFRWRHWLFAREYIIRRSSHPTATGGSPIVTWLPNQLEAVMELMCRVWESVPGEGKAGLGLEMWEMMENVQDQRGKLKREVERWCRDRNV